MSREREAVAGWHSAIEQAKAACERLERFASGEHHCNSIEGALWYGRQQYARACRESIAALAMPDDLATVPVGPDGRRGDWLQTASGRRFWPLDPRPHEVEIDDIAHALAQKCRYNGHSVEFYSVAEHSVLLSWMAPEKHALWALLHDASEAYLADIPRPVKPFIPGWREIEARVMRAVCDRFGLAHDEPAEVKALDHAMLADEKRALMVDGPAWGGIGEPIGVHIMALSPPSAKALFLSRFAELRVGVAA